MITMCLFAESISLPISLYGYETDLSVIREPFACLICTLVWQIAHSWMKDIALFDCTIKLYGEKLFSALIRATLRHNG
jgi:hypothetical protein